jgi:hypothetical protein
VNLSITTRYNQLRLTALASAGQHVDAGQRRAQNRAAARLRAQAVKRIGQRVNLKAGYLRERIELYPSTTTKPQATVRARRRPTRLDRFPYRQLTRSRRGKTKRAGIAVRVLRGQGRKVIHSAFEVPLKWGRNGDPGSSGHGIAVRVDVLRRLGKTLDGGSQGGSGSRRYQVLYSLSLAEMMQREIDTGVLDDTRRYYQQQVDLEMQRAISRSRR